MNANSNTPIEKNSELNPDANENFNFIKAALSEKLKVNKFTFKLIYKATRDGDSEEEFHSKCDNINNNLIIIKTKENNIFGGFTTTLLNRCGNYNYDTYSFLFSLNKKIIYNINKEYFEVAIFCGKGFCIKFGHNYGDLVLKNRFLSSNNNYVYNGPAYFDKNDPAFILNNGMRNFFVNECEIYQVIPQI